MKQLVKNAADPEQVRKAKEREEYSRERDLDDVAFVLSTPVGRRFLWRQLEKAGIFRTSFNPSGSVVYFNEGRRIGGLELLADINEANAPAYLQMIQEAQREQDNVPDTNPSTKETGDA